MSAGYKVRLRWGGGGKGEVRRGGGKEEEGQCSGD